MSNETLRAYFLDLGDALLQHHTKFASAHPDFQGVDCVVVAEVKINGEKLLGKLDNGQKSVELCKRYLEAYG